MASPWETSADPVDFDEAIEWFRQRVPMTRDDWDGLLEGARAKAFTVSHVAQVDTIAHAWTALDSALANGDTFEDFKSAIGDELEDSWGSQVANPEHRLETIFRTNVQSAYGAGRYRQLNNPAVKRRRPYRRMNVLLDNQTSGICTKVAGVLLPADHPWWRGRIPPLHFNCRTTIDALTEAEALALGVTRSPPHVEAQDGFGHDPDVSSWEPDPDDYPEELGRELRRKLED